eukprot:scaffold127152_cov16-Prasinocladus_malaysianus.AAC.1
MGISMWSLVLDGHLVEAAVEEVPRYAQQEKVVGVSEEPRHQRVGLLLLHPYELGEYPPVLGLVDGAEHGDPTQVLPEVERDGVVGLRYHHDRHPQVAAREHHVVLLEAGAEVVDEHQRGLALLGGLLGALVDALRGLKVQVVVGLVVPLYRLVADRGQAGLRQHELDVVELAAVGVLVGEERDGEA